MKFMAANYLGSSLSYATQTAAAQNNSAAGLRYLCHWPLILRLFPLTTNIWKATTAVPTHAAAANGGWIRDYAVVE